MSKRPYFVVTGGAGFIGSQLIRELRKQYPEHGIHVIDNFSHSNVKALWGFDGSISVRTLSKETAFDIPHEKNIKCIFHLAALSNTATGSLDDLIEQNVNATEMLIRAAIQRRIPVVYASSASVYGNVKASVDGSGARPMEESQEMRPVSNYGFSKMLADSMAKRYIEELRWPIVGLRYFNVYGPGEEHKRDTNSCSPILHFYHQLRESGKITLFLGSKEFRRDFIHVQDAVAATILAYKKGVTGILNVGTGYSESFYDVAGLVAKELGFEIDDCVVWKTMPADMASRYQGSTCSHTGNVERELGFHPRFIELTDGVKNYIEYLKEDDNG